MKKRILALGLCLALAMSLLTGCGGELTDEQIITKATNDEVKYLTDGKLKNDTVIMTINGEDVSAISLCYWLSYYETQMAYYYSMYGETLDLTAEVSDGVTAADSLLDYAYQAVVSYTTMDQKAAEYELTLTEDEESNVQEYMDLQDTYSMLYFCTTAEEQGEIYRQYQLSTKLQDVLYAEGGEREITDETLQDYITDNGIYNCRYILCQADEDDEDAVAEAQTQAQEIYDELSALEGDALLEKFMEYQEQNADGNTDEYSYSDDDSLVDGFKESVADLEVGQLGMTDQTSYGYFVLLRLDVDMDTVKEDYISSDFNSQMTTWADEAEVELANAYDKLDAQTFLENLTELQTVVSTAQEAADSSAEAS
ncbi:MAG: peptidyl-prolyl cis-trans isomerase [Clostridiales bacterium]|nr:peptidyl-prolyl cis-trans isomerase [Clostridiales bacterium]MCD8334240.1 peptidyl-prolyl cis-trans isomerase [Clostridiales bacterium]